VIPANIPKPHLAGAVDLRPDEGLFFANADALRNEIIHLVDEAQPPVQVVLLDLEMSNQLDVPSVDMLGELKEELERRKVEMWLARLHGPVRDALERSGVLQKFDRENVHSRMLESLLEYLAQGRVDPSEDIAVVQDALKMTEVIDKLSHPAVERRKVLEGYHQKLSMSSGDHPSRSRDTLDIVDKL
jgi:MFS superfamily sulfate permease-like transporter